MYLGINLPLLKTNRFIIEIYEFFSCEFSISLTKLHVHPLEMLQIRVLLFLNSYIIKVKQSRYRPGVAQRFPGS